MVIFCDLVLSTTVEIILYYLTVRQDFIQDQIYNSRNYSILLNLLEPEMSAKSTTVEIILYYLTKNSDIIITEIYNSRNYSILLNL